MHESKQTKGIEFYHLLFENDEFNAELGKVTLAAGRLEAEIMRLFNRSGIKEKYTKLTLGQLIKIGKKNNLFDKNLTIALEQIGSQRNYLTHNIYALFIELIDETVLGKNNLLVSDVTTYTDMAWQLRINLIDLADIISEK